MATLGIDICDNTPIVDLKPFCPSDIVDGTPTYAEWIEQFQLYEVKFLEEAEEELKKLVELKQSVFLKTLEGSRQILSEVLRNDIRSVYQGRGEAFSKTQQCKIDNIQVFFRLEQNSVVIEKVKAISSS